MIPGLRLAGAALAVVLALGGSLAAAPPETSAGGEKAASATQGPRTSTALRVGDIYYRRGSWWGALQQYQRAVKEGVDDPVVFYRLGRAARQLRRPDESREWFERAAEAYESRTQGGKATLEDWYLLASVYAHLDAADQRRETAQRALEAVDASAEQERGPADWVRLSRLYGYAGESEEAEQAIQRAIEGYRALDEIDGEDLLYGEVMLARARQAMAAGDYERARELYQEIARKRPETSGALYELGLARLRAKDPEGAMRAWRRATSIDPSHGTEANYASHLLARLVDHAAAYPDAEVLEVESRFADMNRGQLEGEIARAFGELRAAMQELQASQGTGQGTDLPMQTSVHQAAVDRAEADLAAALLAYHLRGLPVRDVASQYRLLGWIFARR